MKFKFVASKRDVLIFVIFAIFLLYVVALGVLNIPCLASEGSFYGLNPLEAFSSTYIYYTLLFYFLALGGLFLSVNSYFFEFEEGIGIKIGPSSSGGYSTWAKAKDIKTDTDVKKVFAADEKSDYAGVPLISNGKELWVDNGEYHTLVIGATGSGKTQDTILPAIKVLAKHGESVVVTDPKGEIYEKAGGLLKKNGYNIILLNFRSPQNGNTWNPLELPYRLYKNGNQDKAIELLDDLALNILYEETNNNDPFWEKTAADYFSGIALAMFEDATEDKININSINMTATVGEDKFGGSTYIKEYFNTKDPASAAYVNASGTVMAPSETKGGIISVFKQKVKLFASRENLSEMLSYSDFPLDIIGKEKTALFIIIQDEKKTYHSLATILVKQIYETLIDVAQENGGKLPVRTNFLLDEFANMPPLKDVTTMITAARSRQIRFTMIIQNFAQLNKVYGKDDAETIKGNCGNIIYLISTELAALEEISKLCGEKKSKKDDKTASTPLVTVSDLQRMKKFDHIILRMRKNPFKTSFVPDFKIDWGKCTSPKLDYPTREKREVAIFDIRDYVKEKKNQKLNEMMASISGDSSSSTSSPFGSGGGARPSIQGNSSGFGGGFNSSRPTKERPQSNPDFSINDIVKKIDEKLAEIDREEQEAKKKEQEKKNNDKPLDEPKKVENNVTINNYYEEKEKPKKEVSEPKKPEKVEMLDDDLFISNEELERKVNEKLANNLVKYENESNKVEQKVDEQLKEKIDEHLDTFDTRVEKTIDKKVDSFDDKIEKNINSKIDSFDNKIDKKIDTKIDNFEYEVDRNLDNKIDSFDKKIDKSIDSKLEDFDKEMEAKINSKLKEIEETAKNEKLKQQETMYNDNFEEKEVANSKDANYDPYVGKSDYEPYVVTDEDEEMLKVIENEIEGLKENNNNNNSFKPTSTIKLDSVSDDERFFDDFFDD